VFCRIEAEGAQPFAFDICVGPNLISTPAVGVGDHLTRCSAHEAKDVAAVASDLMAVRLKMDGLVRPLRAMYVPASAPRTPRYCLDPPVPRVQDRIAVARRYARGMWRSGGGPLVPISEIFCHRLQPSSEKWGATLARHSPWMAYSEPDGPTG
jgi:hypothetical protein